MWKSKAVIKFGLYILSFCYITSCVLKEEGKAENPIKIDLKSQLETLFDKDQFYRKKFGAEFAKNGPSSNELYCINDLMERADSINAVELEIIFSNYGWPEQEIIGTKGNNAIFLILQHANLDFQKKYLPLLLQAYDYGKIGGEQLALMRDRMSFRETGYQIYGSQLISRGSTGKYGLRPLLYPTKVDSLRSLLGLIPLEDYVSQWNMEDNWLINSSR